MDRVLVRYGEMGTKSYYVQEKMFAVLRQRVADRLEYENLPYEKVSTQPGRIIVETEKPQKAAQKIAEIPGVASVSPAIKTDAEIERLKEASERFEYGETFGIEASRAGEHSFSSQEIKEEIGAHVQEFTGAEVDLDDPDTWLGIDVRYDEAFVFTQRFPGPDGLPVGTQDKVVALISGGIDSPVAAYEMMKRGCDIVPVYFYNKPVAAEDHWLRMKSVVKELERFHPSKKWEIHRVDMEEINQELLEIERGRMLLHRSIMFSVAGKIAEKTGAEAIVTGESLGQKSSQTSSNLALTSLQTEKSVFRPLLSHNKEEIVEKAKRLNTFELAKIDSACTTIAPDNPATSIQDSEFRELQEKVDFETLRTTGINSIKKISL